MASSQKVPALLVTVCFVFLSGAAATSIRCPLNSVYISKPFCYNTCDNLNACYEPTMPCQCIDGYVFKSQDSYECVPVSSCKANCLPYSTFNDCYRIPLETCENLGATYTPGQKCMARCVCIEGYVLTNNANPQCIKKTKCPQ
ncbi:uncharacterized protein RB166_012660 [Leptodactylus fuscus]